MKKLIRWLLNKDELERIANELHMIRMLLQAQKQMGPLKPMQPMGLENNKP